MEKITFIEKIKNTEREVVLGLLAPKIGSPILRRETPNFCLRGERQLKFWEVGWIFCATFRYFFSWQLWTSFFISPCGLGSLVLGSCMFFLLSFWVDGLPAGLTCPGTKNQRMYFSDFRLELGTPYVSARNLEWNEKPNKELIKIIQEFFFSFFF